MLWPKKGAFENANDLKEQAFYRFIAKTYWGHIALQFAVLYALGGWPWFVWLGCVRVSLLALMVIVIVMSQLFLTMVMSGLVCSRLCGDHCGDNSC